MNIDYIKENYSMNTKIVFKSISSKLAKKLFLFAITHKILDTITINGVKYTLNYVSWHGRFNSVSVYFSARNRLYRISDHWSFIYGRGGAKLTSCGSFGKKPCNWTLTGPEQWFDISGVNHKYGWYDEYFRYGSYIWDSGRLEGGYTEWSRIKKNH